MSSGNEKEDSLLLVMVNDDVTPVILIVAKARLGLLLISTVSGVPK
jgi:hypothetical protein